MSSRNLQGPLGLYTYTWEGAQHIPLTRLILIRHGETIWNRQKRYMGHSDVPLNETGVRQAEALAVRLASEPFEAIYSSDLQRARRTAEIIARDSGVAVRLDPRLRELSFGQWEGTTEDDLRSAHPQEYLAWQTDPSFVPPGGESMDQLGERAYAALREIARNHLMGTVTVVAHGGSLHAGVLMALGMPLRGRWSFYLYNASISELWIAENEAVLVRVNDTHHLAPATGA